MANPWFRMYHEWADDPKVQMMPEDMQRRLIMLFCDRCSDVTVTLQERQIAFRWRISDAQLAETKALFIEQGFIDGDWQLANWDRRQFLSDSSTERTRQYRERKRTSQERHGDAGVTNCDALDTDTDSDEKRTEKKRKEKEALTSAKKPASQSTKKPQTSPAGRQDRKGLVEVGEDLKELGKAKSSLASETIGDLEKSALGCDISLNPTRLPETTPLDGSGEVEEQKQGATPPPQPQQDVVEALVRGKPTRNEPSAVISQDWPEEVDWDDAITELIKLHPLPKFGNSTRTAVIIQIDLIEGERGKGKWDAYTYLLGRVMQYAAAVALWSKRDKDFIVGILNFMEEGIYRQDDSRWERSDSGNRNSDGLEEDVSAEGEGGGAEGSPRTLIVLPDADAFRAIRKGLQTGPGRFTSGGSYLGRH